MTDPSANWSPGLSTSARPWSTSYIQMRLICVARQLDVVGGQAAATAPARVGHDQRERDVLVGVAGGAHAQHLRAGGVDVPVHEAVGIEPALRIQPQLVERRLFAGVDGQQHAVGDAFRHRRVDLAPRRVRAARAQVAAGAVGGHDLRVPGVVGGARRGRRRPAGGRAAPHAGDDEGAAAPPPPAAPALRRRARPPLPPPRRCAASVPAPAAAAGGARAAAADRRGAAGSSETAASAACRPPRPGLRLPPDPRRRAPPAPPPIAGGAGRCRRLSFGCSHPRTCMRRGRRRVPPLGGLLASVVDVIRTGCEADACWS